MDRSAGGNGFTEAGEILVAVDENTRLPYGVSRYYAELAQSNDPQSDPIAAQFVPRAEERIELPYEDGDPIGDRRYRVTERLIHHYRDRVLLLVNDRCATYCRHCFRRHFTGHGGGRLSDAQLAECCAYLRATPEVAEILLSGGDPLMLSDAEIDHVIRKLREVNPEYIIRVCTRMPVVLPARITESCAAMLGSHGSIWAVIHTNHPREITDAFKTAVGRLARSGVPVLNQAVLLRGINDSVETLETLFRGLVRCGVKPYYLFQGDLASGTSHFRVPLDRGMELVRALRGRLSGIAMPTYALDLPDGGGKVPIESAFVRAEPDHFVLRGPEGREYSYPRETSPRERDSRVD